MVKFLDDISVDNVIKVSDLIQQYPLITKPIGAKKLSHKPLDKLIKKYAEKYNISPDLYPVSRLRWASTDLHYWIKQMFQFNDDNQLLLINWREIIQRKVQDSRTLQEKLVSDLYSFDIEEAKFWAHRFQLEDQIPQEDHDNDEEEDWGIQSTDTEVARVESKCPDRDENWDNLPDLDVSNSSNQDNQQFLSLPFPHKDILWVEDKKTWRQFIHILETTEETVVGVDAEFMSSSRTEQKISLLQLALDQRAFLLDFESLPDCLEDSDYQQLKSLLFFNKKLMIVGFGVVGDVKLLSRSFTQFQDVVQSRNVLDLEMIRTKLMILVQCHQSSIRGLSGFSASVLGKPLNKSEQIGDWSRRPLRQSQLVYAAMDAWVCLAIFKKLEEKSLDLHVEKEFQELIKSEVNRTETSSKSKTKKEKSSTSREDAQEQLKKSVPDLDLPLFNTVHTVRDVKLVCDTMLQVNTFC